jgi:hypothetical protein
MRFARRFAIFSVLSSFPGFEPQARDDAFFEPIAVCCAEGDGGAGGGGSGGGAGEGGAGGGGSGGAGDGGAGGGQTPQYVTVEQLNAAIGSHLGRALPKALEPFNKQFGDINETLKKLATPKVEPTEEEKNRQRQSDPETLALKNQLEELKQANQREREAREKAEATQRDNAAFAHLRSLVAKSVRPELVDVVAKNLFYAEKVITYDESGKALFKSRRAQYQGGPEEEVATTLEDGVQQYLKTKEAQVFLPPPTSKQPTNNGGNRQPTRFDGGLPVYDKPATTDQEKVRRAMEREAALEKQQS